MPNVKTRIENIPMCTEGAGYITINGQNRKLFELSKLSATVEVKTWEKQLLGSRMEQGRAIGLKGSGSMSFYHMTSDFIDLLAEYKKTGVFPAITIQGYHDDPASEVGRLEVVLYHCILKKIPLLAIEEAASETAPQDSDLIFGDYDILDKFKKLVSY